MDAISWLAITFLVIGSVGMGGAAVMERRTNQPKYKMMVKILPWFIGVAGVLIGIGLAVR